MITLNGISVLFLSLVTSGVTIPAVMYLSRRYKLYDRIDERKIHNGNISRLGGTGIFIGFLISYVWIFSQSAFPEESGFSLILFTSAAVLIFLTGLFDDIFPLNPRIKLIMQISCASLAAFSGLRISEFTLFSITFSNPYVLFAFTVIWMIIFMNAINLIDGIDGLSSGIIIIASTFMAIISLSCNCTVSLFLSCALSGSVIGFYVYNYPPAKIFMGDGGAYFTGFILSAIPLMNISEGASEISLLVPLILLFVPLSDIIQVCLIRLREGVHIFRADNNHIHHRLMHIGLHNKKIIYSIFTFTLILGILALVLIIASPEKFFIFFSVILLLAFTFIFMLNTSEKISDDSENNHKDNNRVCQRIFVNDLIALHKGDKTIEAFTFDAAPTGLSFYSPVLLIEHDIISVDYRIQDLNKTVKMKIIVEESEEISKNFGFYTRAEILEIEEDKKEIFMDNYYQRITSGLNNPLLKSISL